MNGNFSLHKFSLAPGNQPPSFSCVFIPSGIMWLRIWAGWFLLRKWCPGLHWALIPWVWFLFESVSSEIKSFDYMTVRWSPLNSTLLSSLNSSQEMSLFIGREKVSSSLLTSSLRLRHASEGQRLHLCTWPCADSSGMALYQFPPFPCSFNLSPRCLLPFSP